MLMEKTNTCKTMNVLEKLTEIQINTYIYTRAHTEACMHTNTHIRIDTHTHIQAHTKSGS